MDAGDLAFAGLVRQREMLADGSLKARELVSMYVDRIESHNSRLNAFVSVRAEAALRAADQAQQSLDRGDSRPLLGIPFAVKDEHDLAGEVPARGTGATTEVAQRDAEIVRVLREAGAIPVGKTTLPELGMHPFTESVTWGVTRNPWDLSRTPGGSSGGGAAAVAAGLVSFATAGDGGGSIRIPASCCNLFGLKVQRGRVTTLPRPESAGGLSVFGVLTRGVTDAALLYDLLADASARPDAPTGWKRSLRDSVAADPGRLRIGVTFELGVRTRVAREVQVMVARVADALGELGHAVSEVRVDPGSWLLPFTILGMRVLIDEAQPLEAPARLERRTRTALRTGSLMSERMLSWAIGRQQVTATRTNRVFDAVDLVLTPTLTQPPAETGKWGGMGALRTSRGVRRWCPYTSLWNFIGQPKRYKLSLEAPAVGWAQPTEPPTEPRRFSVVARMAREWCCAAGQARRVAIGLVWAVVAAPAASVPASASGRTAPTPIEAVSTRVVDDGAATVPDLRARRLRLPRLGAGLACPTANADLNIQGVGPAVSAGPVAAALFADPPGLLFGEPDHGGRAAKVLWLVSATQAQPVIVRARRVDGRGSVRFSNGLGESRVYPLTGDATSTAPPEWRDVPSSIRVREPGCYEFQIDGPGFQSILVLGARSG